MLEKEPHGTHLFSSKESTAKRTTPKETYSSGVVSFSVSVMPVLITLGLTTTYHTSLPMMHRGL